jgi:OOP family OmpA-OmpF porin
MKNAFGVVMVFALAAVVGGCAGVEIETAKRLDPTGSAFNQALHAEYVERAGIESAEGDYENSDMFAIKAQRAAADEFVVPERVEDHVLPDYTVAAITWARRQLVEALADGGRTTVPELAARAQRMFDCWVEEQEENRQPDDILACRGAFWDAIDEIQEAIKKPEPVAAAPELEPEPEPEPAPPPPAAIEVPMMPVFFVLFDFDSASLDAKGVSLVENIAEQILARDPARVFVSGHTDRAGSNAYNEALSERRGQTVASALARLGVDDLIVTVSAMSEDELRVETADGVRERQNRYVRVIIIP